MGRRLWRFGPRRRRGPRGFRGWRWRATAARGCWSLGELAGRAGRALDRARARLDDLQRRLWRSAIRLMAAAVGEQGG